MLVEIVPQVHHSTHFQGSFWPTIIPTISEKKRKITRASELKSRKGRQFEVYKECSQHSRCQFQVYKELQTRICQSWTQFSMDPLWNEWTTPEWLVSASWIQFHSCLYFVFCVFCFVFCILYFVFVFCIFCILSSCILNQAFNNNCNTLSSCMMRSFLLLWLYYRYTAAFDGYGYTSPAGTAFCIS